MAESDLHRRLKRAASRWLWQHGYAAIAEEVGVPGVGVIDVAGAGKWCKHNPRRASFQREPTVDREHVVFVECKAMRADFIRDVGRQQQFAFALQERGNRRRLRRPSNARRAHVGLGKFDTCLLRPHANLHYLMVPAGLLKAAEIPRRWGLLVWDAGHVRVQKKPAWMEHTTTGVVEAAIARSLTTSAAYRMGWIARQQFVNEMTRPVVRAAGT